MHDDLAAEFGKRVANLVAELTDDKRLPKADRKQRQVEHAPHLSVAAKQIKLADKLCNLREMLTSPPIGWSHERSVRTLVWSKQVVDGVRGANPALERRFDETYTKGTLTFTAMQQR